MANITKYILSKRIARGGMAELFLARAIDAAGHTKICAIKRILPHFASDREYLEMFRSEAGICKKLQHPNIVRVFDFRNVDGHYALVMEFVNGTDLRTLLAACEKARVRMSVPMCIFLAAQVAKGLHFAHTKIDDATGQPMGIVHRDISPQNILVSYDGEVKIIDFGIANFEAKNLETKPGVVKGKYSYMSPEQVSAKRLDARSDIFSLTIILWEILAMKRLFAGDTEVETITSVQNCAIKFNLKELNKSVDDALMRIIAKGLEKDRKYRYANAQAMEIDLNNFLTGHFPDFKPAELGEFVSQLLAIRRIETNHDIKKLLAPAPKNSTPAESAENSGENLTKIRSIHHPHKKAPESEQRPATSGNVAYKAAPSEIPFKSSQTRNSQQKQIQQRQQRLRQLAFLKQVKAQQISTRNMIMGFIVFLAAMAGGAFYWQQQKKPIKGSMQLVLKTKPAEVMIKLDNKRLYGGNFIRTPLKISLPAGKRRLTVERAGYEIQEIQLKGVGGEVLLRENIVLKPSAKSNFASLRIIDSNQLPVFVEINNGMYSGKTPTTLTDLVAGKEQVLTVFPSYPSKKDAFQCKFTIATGKNPNLQTLSISRGAKAASSRCSIRAQK